MVASCNFMSCYSWLNGCCVDDDVMAGFGGKRRRDDTFRDFNNFHNKSKVIKFSNFEFHFHFPRPR
jgi:hypothetical protein